MDRSGLTDGTIDDVAAQSSTDMSAENSPRLGGAPQALLVLMATLMLCGLAVVFTRRTAGDPFGGTAQAAPLVVALVLAGVIASLGALRSRINAGLVGAIALPVWVCFFCSWQLTGTPYPYGGNLWDIGRLTAFATRFTVSTASADQFVRGIPSDYPPLFPWLVGKTSVLTGIPAWRLIGSLEIVFTALAVTAGFLLWRRIFPSNLAIAVSVVPLAVQGDPRKAYEVMALCVLTPWVLATFGRWPDRPRLPWLPAGLVGGLMVSMYNGYLVYAALGIVAIVALGLLQGDRAAYVRHLVLTIVVATVVSSWYLVPWFVDTIRFGSQNMWVHFWPPYVRKNLLYLPWSHGPWVSPLIIGGLVLLVYYSRRETWARYQLAIVLSVMVYRWVWVVVHHYTGNSGIAVHTDRVSDGVTLVGLTCGLWQLSQDYLQRRTEAPREGQPALRMSPLMRAVAGPLALAVVLGISLSVFWQDQRVGVAGNYAQQAQATRLPDGAATRYAYHVKFRPFHVPVQQVRDDVESVLGRNALPVALSYSEQISAYAPFYLYLGVGGYSANSLSHFPDRVAEVRRLSGISDPVAFARATASSRYGPIDVFILRARGDKMSWGHGLFGRQQFSPRFFATFEEPGPTVVFVRRGAHVDHQSYPR